MWYNNNMDGGNGASTTIEDIDMKQSDLKAAQIRYDNMSDDVADDFYDVADIEFDTLLSDDNLEATVKILDEQYDVQIKPEHDKEQISKALIAVFCGTYDVDPSKTYYGQDGVDELTEMVKEFEIDFLDQP